MNFKFTKWKSIISILVIIFVDLSLSSSVIVVCMLAPGGVCTQPVWYEFALDPTPVTVSLIAGLLVYIIWSLFQKKSKRK